MPYEVKQRSKTLPSKFSEEIHNRHTFNLSTLLNIRALCDWNSSFRTETFLTWQEPQSVKRHQRSGFRHSSLDCSYFQGWSLVWQTLIHEHVDIRSTSTANTNLGITWSRIEKRKEQVISITDIKKIYSIYISTSQVPRRSSCSHSILSHFGHVQYYL